jgi:two-component system, cell cycle response regulator
MTAAILEKIRTAENLPSLPAVAVQVLKMTQADDVSVAEIARVIQQDPALTGRLLKIVNSSLFGMSRQISSLQQAMVVLGLRTVKVMILSFSLVDTMRARKPGAFDFSAYWRRSLTTASASRLLAERVRRTIADEAFVSGLLCDLGMLAAYHCAKNIYTPVVIKYEAGHEPLQVVEQQVLGVTHESMSKELLNHWGLPDALCRTVLTHHAAVDAPTPSQDPTEVVLARIIRASAMIADLFCADVRAGRLDESRQQIIEGLPIDESSLQEMLELLDAHVKETASLFALNIGPTRCYEEIQAEACVQLARLSMAAELERAQIAQREEAVRRKVDELSDQNCKLTQQATTDALTGIGNRAAMERRLQEEVDNAIRQGQYLGVLMLDVDRFKRLNDTFGHQNGDEALRQIGSCLKRIAGDTRFAARYGGEEFVMIVANVTERQLREVAEEIRMGVQELRIPHGQKTISITASVGGSNLSPEHMHFDPKHLIEIADQCLYDAKHGGRNRVVLMDETHAASHAPAVTG